MTQATRVMPPANEYLKDFELLDMIIKTAIRLQPATSAENIILGNRKSPEFSIPGNSTDGLYNIRTAAKHDVIATRKTSIRRITRINVFKKLKASKTSITIETMIIIKL